jgi:hypothetical protein
LGVEEMVGEVRVVAGRWCPGERHDIEFAT